MTKKYEELKCRLVELQSLAVAFSGGVDSALLLKIAYDALGQERVVAVTARSASFPEREIASAAEFCQKLGVRHIVIDSEELDIEGYASNPANRCYLCKRELFTKMRERALEEGFPHIAEGSNIDDLGDYRPGLTAAAELGALSPLREAGLTKREIRELSKELELSTWDKPAFACLASRFPYGERITKEKLDRVNKAEEYLLGLGARQVRVRSHGDIARIEAEGEGFDKIAAKRGEVSDTLCGLGFTFAALDLAGYKTGSMNKTLKNKG